MDDVTGRAAAYWDAQAATFDEEPDHGLRDPSTRSAWHERLRAWLPPTPAAVLDLGCGTGSLSVLLAADGYRVTGLDVSDAMLAAARSKAAAEGVDARFGLADAADPPIEPHAVDVVLVRHLVWALPDPPAALRRWVERLRPGGTLVLIEGLWATSDPTDDDPPEGLPWGRGVDAATLRAAVEPMVAEVEVHDLAGDDRLWGRAVDDHRFALVARTALDGPA